VYVELVAPDIGELGFIHTYVNPVPVLAVSTTLPPWQNVVGPDAVMVAPGLGLIVTLIASDVSEHPFVFVTITR
jgi:hypothetical protein